MAGDPQPTTSDRRSIIPTLYEDGTIANRPERYEQHKGGHLVETMKNRGILTDGFAVVDPRFVGYEFPSYTLIETKNEVEEVEEGADDAHGTDRLSQAFNAYHTHFPRSNKALMLGVVLGDFDIIHRRVDEDRYANARFVKDAKMNELGAELDFFQVTETYPIFEIIRWHGKNSPEPLSRKPDRLSAIQLEIIRQLRADASLSNAEIEGNITAMADDGAGELLVDPDAARQLTDNVVEEEREELEKDDIILGYSVDYDPQKFHLHQALMGITVEPGQDGADSDARDPDGNHQSVRASLLANLADRGYDDDLLTNFKMPYITSGVGQNWGDIMVELRVEAVSDINEIARRFRNLPGVRTTRTYLTTKTSFDRTFEINNYHALLEGRRTARELS